MSNSTKGKAHGLSLTEETTVTVLRKILKTEFVDKCHSHHFVLEPLQNGNISEDFRVTVMSDDDSQHYEA